MSSEITGMDRAAVRRMVEDFWRSLILQGRHWGQLHPTLSRAEFEARYSGQARDISHQFTARMEAIASLMPPEQAELLLQMVGEEDSIYFDEHQRNPGTFYRRLGLALTSAPRANL